MTGRGFINLLGPLFTRAFKPGASEVKSVRGVSGSTSINRVTVLTPTSGKAIRVITCMARTISTTASALEIYFGTGTNVGTNAGNEVTDNEVVLPDFPTIVEAWPDGAGPVGAIDEVLSFRTSVEIGANAVIVVHYREE